MSAIATARQVCWGANSQQAQSRVAWARAVPRDRCDLDHTVVAWPGVAVISSLPAHALLPIVLFDTDAEAVAGFRSHRVSSSLRVAGNAAAEIALRRGPEGGWYLRCVGGIRNPRPTGCLLARARVGVVHPGVGRARLAQVDTLGRHPHEDRLGQPHCERSCPRVLISSPSRSSACSRTSSGSPEGLPRDCVKARKAFTHSGTASSVLASTVTCGVGVLRRASTAEGAHPRGSRSPGGAFRVVAGREGSVELLDDLEPPERRSVVLAGLIGQRKRNASSRASRWPACTSLGSSLETNVRSSGAPSPLRAMAARYGPRWRPAIFVGGHHNGSAASSAAAARSSEMVARR